MHMFQCERSTLSVPPRYVNIPHIVQVPKEKKVYVPRSTNVVTKEKVTQVAKPKHINVEVPRNRFIPL